MCSFITWTIINLHFSSAPWWAVHPWPGSISLNIYVNMKVIQLCLSLCNPMDYTVHGILLTRILEWVAFPFSRGSSQPRDQTQVSSLKADSLPAELQGKPKNTGVSSLTLLQRICLTQESNWSLLHYRWILYQLNYQGSLIYL